MSLIGVQHIFLLVFPFQTYIPESNPSLYNECLWSYSHSLLLHCYHSSDLDYSSSSTTGIQPPSPSLTWWTPTASCLTSTLTCLHSTKWIASSSDTSVFGRLVFRVRVACHAVVGIFWRSGWHFHTRTRRNLASLFPPYGSMEGPPFSCVSSSSWLAQQPWILQLWTGSRKKKNSSKIQS